MGYTHGTPKNSPFRICSRCKQELPNTTEYFNWSNSNKSTIAICKKCSSIEHKNRNQRMKSRFQDQEGHIFYDGTKLCKKCNRELPNNYYYFPEDKSTVSGLRNVCRECSPKYAKFLNENSVVPSKWNEEELKLLIDNYKKYTGKELQKQFFPNRTIRSINSQADVHNLLGKNEDAYRRGRAAQAKAITGLFVGRTWSDESRKKMSSSMLKHYETHEPYWKGRNRSPQQCKQISERQKGKWAGDKNPRKASPLTGSLNGRWKGGILSTYLELRSESKQWQQESMSFCSYQCVITGSTFDNIHHTTPFRDMVDLAFKNTGIMVRPKVQNYSQEEFNILRKEILNLHRKLGYGACINKKVHKLFHDSYGYTHCSPRDFLDFIYRIDIGDYDYWFDKNHLPIMINYGYVEYLEHLVDTQFAV